MLTRFSFTLFLLVASTAAAQDWPTLHRDPQRSGHVGDVLRGPFERKWYRDFHDEMIASRVEAIVADGKVFVGTFAGTFYALDVVDGRTLWTFKTKGAIGHSPCWHDGRVYVGADDGRLHALKAADGSLLWSYDAGAGIWVAPACDGARVYVGDRAGVFHAVDSATGTQAWTLRTGGPILKPASIAPDGAIVFGSEDMSVHAVEPTGKRRWTSPKLQGVSMRDAAPTIWKGLVVVRTAPADGFHEVMNRNQDFLARVQKSIPSTPEDKIIDDKHGAYILRYRKERHEAELDAVVKHLRENPHDRTFYAFRLEDGSEPWIAPVFYTCGLHNPATPPTFDPGTGACYTYYRTSLTNFSRGVRPFTGVGRLDRETGRIENLWHAQGDEPGWSDFATIGDETQTLSLMGEILLSTHQGTLGGLVPSTRKWFPIVNARDTYGGIFGPGALPGGWEGEKKHQREGSLVNMPNEWHGPDKSAMAIAAKRIFWVTGSQVVCIAGPDVPKAETGGTKPPPVIRKRFDRVVTAGGNLTADRVGGFDATLGRRTISAADVAPFVDASPSAPKGPFALQAKLDAAVLDLVDGGPWAPFIVQLGISKEERHFFRTAETLRLLSQALPYLSPAVREKAKARADALFAGPSVFREEGAKRRELYDLGPGMKAFAAAEIAVKPGGEELYAAWAYGHHAGAWVRVLSKVDDLRKVYEGLPAKIDASVKDSARDLNLAIAGTLAWARIAKRAGRDDEAAKAVARLAELVADRVHHERADSNFVREAARGAHGGSIPRYVDLVPETSAMLLAFAKHEFERNVRDLTGQLPIWYPAFAERMAGGENYTHTPSIARGLFCAQADGGLASPEALTAKLDVPWCRADLYALEKLTALARR